MKKQLKDMRTLFLLSACLLMAACTGRSSQASNDDDAPKSLLVRLELLVGARRAPSRHLGRHALHASERVKTRRHRVVVVVGRRSAN